MGPAKQVWLLRLMSFISMFGAHVLSSQGYVFSSIRKRSIQIIWQILLRIQPFFQSQKGLIKILANANEILLKHENFCLNEPSFSNL